MAVPMRHEMAPAMLARPVASVVQVCGHQTFVRVMHSWVYIQYIRNRQVFWPKQPYAHSTDPLRPALRLPG